MVLHTLIAVEKFWEMIHDPHVSLGRSEQNIIPVYEVNLFERPDEHVAWRIAVSNYQFTRLCPAQCAQAKILSVIRTNLRIMAAQGSLCGTDNGVGIGSRQEYFVKLALKR